MVTAAVTLGLSGPFSLQARQAARGLELWAEWERIDLRIVDDSGSPSDAVDAYQGWISEPVDLLLGPYGSGLVRRVAPEVTDAGRTMWNHGGSSDDLASPLVVSIVAPASTYFHGVIHLAQRTGLTNLVVGQGRGRFAAEVALGAYGRASTLGLEVRHVSLDRVTTEPLGGAAVLMVGRFTDDIAAVERVRQASKQPALLACVAAGLPEFGRSLGTLAEDVMGPVQWRLSRQVPDVGPASRDFAGRYRQRYDASPDYVAAQAAAVGFLATEAHRRGLGPEEIRRWRTSTLLGGFALDDQWRQVGHKVSTIQWGGGKQQPVT